MTEGFIKESTDFLEKLVYCNDRVKTLNDTFNKKSDVKDERHHFYRLLTLQTKHGFSGKKDAKSLAAELDTVRRMNGNKKEGWGKYSDRVANLLLRQQLIDFKSTTAPNRKKTVNEIKNLLHKNLTGDIIAPEQRDEKEEKKEKLKYPSSLGGQLNTGKLVKKKWDEINSKKKQDNNIKNHFEPIAGWQFLCVQKMNNRQVASFLDLMENESTKMRDNVTLLPFFKQDLEGNKTIFGSRNIHKRIIARDMELLGKNSQLLQKNEDFLQVWASKLEKVSDLNPIYNDEMRTKYLHKLKKWMDQYVRGGAANSLKALILYNLLADQERLGKYDRELFREYLSVPKATCYNKSVILNKKWKNINLAKFDYTINTKALYPIINDQQLVYRYFRKLFQKKDEQAKKWTEFVDTDYVKAVLCESRLMNVNGKGSDVKKMYTKVRGKYAVQSLEKKVVIEVEQQNQRYYQLNDSVNIKVLVKNVSSLMINVYIIHQKNYYKQYGREVDINMNLDGLSANFIINKRYKENSFLLRSRNIEIKDLKDKRGVFLLDILGNGKRARCLIRKGQLRYIARQEFNDENKDDNLQYVLTVLGHQNKAITKSRITINNNEYESDEKGNVYIPFASHNDIMNAPIILENIKFGAESATLQFFDYKTENYTSECGLYIDRESLIASQSCKIFIRPNLFLNSQAVSIAALQDTSLLVRARIGGDNKDGDASEDEENILIKKFRLNLSDKRESSVDYDVPSELRSIELILSGKIWVSSQNKFVTLSNSSIFSVNSIDDSKALGQCLLIPFDNKYILKIVGKNGEKLCGIKVLFKLKHKYLKKELEFRLQSDKDGNIKLGDLADIEAFNVFPENNKNKTLLFEKQSFKIPSNTVNIAQIINVNQGCDVLIPLMTENISPRCDVYDSNFIKIYENVQYNAGYIKISQLPAGDFIAMIRDTQNVDVNIHVSKGIGCCGHSVSADRIVELSELKSLQIVQSKGSRGAGYKVKLDGYNSKYTRVHAISSFGVPQFNAFEFLASPTSLPQIYHFAQYPLQFTPDGKVSNEEDYIYKRRRSGHGVGGVGGDEKKSEEDAYDIDGDDDDDSKENIQKGQRYGNVLETPSLLLNKWTNELLPQAQTDEAQTVELKEEEKEEKEEKKEEEIKEEVIDLAHYGKAMRKEFDPSNMDILGFPARMALNLEADKSGVVAIPSSIIEANHNLLTIIALDENNTSIKYEKLKPSASSSSSVPYSDRRLKQGLDPKRHFSRVRDVLLKQKDECVVFDNWASTTLETYDDFSDIYELYYSIAQQNNRLEMQQNLIDFKFLANWQSLTQQEKMEKYNQYACNEFNFFIKNKDVPFFKSVIVPLLNNRLQKSFFDYYLLENKDKIETYQRLDLYHTLNVVEKILLASVVGGKLAENTVANLSDVVSLKRDHIQEFNALFQQALNAKQFEVTSLSSSQEAKAEAKAESKAEAKAKDSDLSRQYQESRYYRVDFNKQSADLIGANAFWLDYANYIFGKSSGKGGGGFLSKNFGFAANNTAEALLALSVIALPFRGSQSAPSIEIIAAAAAGDGASVKVTVNGATMLLVGSLQETQFKSSSLAVSTNYFDPNDLFEEVDCVVVDKFVDEKAFVSGKMYGCRVVITNVSSVTYQVELLCQIPSGAIPVCGGFQTKNFMKKLSSYATSSLEYYFYFPEIGKFSHYPAHISRNGEVIGYSLRRTDICVIDSSSVFDINCWQYISSSKPNSKDVLENVKNSLTLRNEDLSRLSWRCADEKFFKELTNILRRKQLFNSKIWKYGLIHGLGCEVEVQEYLLRHDKFMSLLSPALTGENTGDPLFINYNAYQRNSYRHIEFFKKDENIFGLFNSRIHSNNVFNKHERFKEIYREFLIRCLYRSYGVKTMSIDDQFCAIFYLIAQNRMKSAQHVFKAMDSKAAKRISAMMYDYTNIFLSFFESDSTKALERLDTVHKWLAVKLPSTKRKMWQAVKKQLNELQNRHKTLDEFQESEIAKQKKKLQVKLNFMIDCNKKQIRIKSKNIEKITANFYLINIEQLFSNSPFTAGRDALSYVQPTTSLTINVKKKDPSDDETLNTIQFPKGFSEKSNFVLELYGNGNDNNNNNTRTRVAKTQYNNSLYVEFNRERGDLFVGNFSKFPVVQAYIKVYLATQLNPNGFFLKDGYTDLRGRFDYLSTDVSMPDDASKVAVLVVSDACGANVYYADIQK